MGEMFDNLRDNQLLKKTVISKIIFIIYFVLWPTDTKLIDRLSQSSYMFRNYWFIPREFVVSTLPS